MMFSRFIRVVACYQNFIPFYGWILFHCMCMPHFVYVLICSLTPGFFPPLAIVISAAVNIGIQLFEPLLSILCNMYLGVELLGCLVILLYLVFWGATKLFSTVVSPFLPTDDVWAISPYLHHLHQHFFPLFLPPLPLLLLHPFFKL